MSRKTHYHALFAYHWHTNQRILKEAAQLDETALRASSIYGGRPILFLLFHILNNDRIWRQALELGVLSATLLDKDFQDLPAIQAGFEVEQRAWEILLNALSPDEIEADCSLTTSRGQAYSMPRWQVLQHVILHGLQHHTELAQLLTAHGHSPGDLDIIFFQVTD